MFKNILAKNNINVWKSIINTKTYGLNTINIASNYNSNLKKTVSYGFSEVYSQNNSRGKYNQRKNKVKFSQDNMNNNNENNWNNSNYNDIFEFK